MRLTKPKLKNDKKGWELYFRPQAAHRNNFVKNDAIVVSLLLNVCYLFGEEHKRLISVAEIELDLWLLLRVRKGKTIFEL